MKKNLIPNMFLDSVFHLDTELLRRRNIKGIIIDIDNTLVAWGIKTADEKVTKLVELIQEAGFKLCILSNNTMERVLEFNKDLSLPAIHNAGKPRKAAFRRAMALMDTEPHNTAVIGDQIFTDILGGNRMGLFTLLVTPISKTEFIGTKLVRQVERFVLRKIDRNTKSN